METRSPCVPRFAQAGGFFFLALFLMICMVRRSPATAFGHYGRRVKHCSGHFDVPWHCSLLASGPSTSTIIAAFTFMITKYHECF